VILLNSRWKTRTSCIKKQIGLEKQMSKNTSCLKGIPKNKYKEDLPPPKALQSKNQDTQSSLTNSIVFNIQVYLTRETWHLFISS